MTKCEEQAPPSLDAAVRQFEATEANLAKLERLWKEIQEAIPDGVAFVVDDEEYDDLCRRYKEVIDHLPAIGGWKIDAIPLDRNTISQWRLDAQEIGEVDAMLSVEEQVNAPSRQIAEYRFRFDRMRRRLVRNEVLRLVAEADVHVQALAPLAPDPGDDGVDWRTPVEAAVWEALKSVVRQIDTLMGSAFERPPRWGELRRHLGFGMVTDLFDVVQVDWPAVRPDFDRLLRADEPLPVETEDLGELVGSQPSGRVVTRLRWEDLTAEDFERLIYSLVSTEAGYENADWLMRTSAPDRGRDVSVCRVTDDSLAGTRREYVIIQCKHWLTRSVTPPDVASLVEQIQLWDPRPDVLVIATTGRFTEDAVAAIERRNREQRLRIEMWPETHLERVLSRRPDLIADFGLRGSG